MVTSPKLSTSILSIPFGPRALFTLSATILAAIMFVCWASFPLERLEPSFNIRTGTPPVAGDDKPLTTSFNVSTRETALQYKFF
jgi:hypothetical protein